MNGYDSDVTLEREEDPRDIGDAYPRFLGHTFAVCDPDEYVEEVEIDSEHVTNSITEKCDKKRCDLLAELWSVRNKRTNINRFSKPLTRTKRLGFHVPKTRICTKSWRY